MESNSAVIIILRTGEILKEKVSRIQLEIQRQILRISGDMEYGENNYMIIVWDGPGFIRMIKYYYRGTPGLSLPL